MTSTDYYYTVTPLKRKHIPAILETMLQLDWDEVIEATGLHPSEVLALAARDPNTVSLVLQRTEDEAPLAVVGGTPMPGELNVFLLATDNINIRDMVFMRKNVEAALETIKDLAGVSPRTPVCCYVWSKNTMHVHWCLNVGFQMTGQSYPALNSGTFIEMTYPCAHPPLH